jgi:transcriptional regulator with XRE-family HTH domain
MLMRAGTVWKERQRFGARLRELRTVAGLTQCELADAIGAAQATICHLERGDTRPSLTMITKLALALDADVDALVVLGDEDEP